MNLKAATLIAIIGNILSFAGAQILRFGVFQWSPDNRMMLNISWCAVQALGTGTLILFLFTLYSKQK